MQILPNPRYSENWDILFCPFLQTAVNLTTLLSKMKLMGNIRKSFSGNDLLRRQQRIDNEISEKAIAKLNTTMEEVLSDI